MRRNTIILIGGMVLLGLLLSAFVSGQTGQGDSTSMRTLGVTGTGRAYLTPDIATISIGVRTDHESASEAVADNNAQIEQVVSALKELGVADKDIQTSNFSIYPQQQYDEKGTITSTTYVVENTVMVMIRDLDMLGDVLDAAVANGANSIYGIQFDVEDKTAAQTEARQKAVEDARVKAGELADAAGVTLGEIHTITESIVYPGPMFDARGGGAAEAAASAVPISPGQLTITSDVNVVFVIE